MSSARDPWRKKRPEQGWAAASRVCGLGDPRLRRGGDGARERQRDRDRRESETRDRGPRRTLTQTRRTRYSLSTGVDEDGRPCRVVDVVVVVDVVQREEVTEGLGTRLYHADTLGRLECGMSRCMQVCCKILGVGCGNPGGAGLVRCRDRTRTDRQTGRGGGCAVVCVVGGSGWAWRWSGGMG